MKNKVLRRLERARSQVLHDQCVVPGLTTRLVHLDQDRCNAPVFPAGKVIDDQFGEWWSLTEQQTETRLNSVARNSGFCLTMRPQGIDRRDDFVELPVGVANVRLLDETHGLVAFHFDVRGQQCG